MYGILIIESTNNINHKNINFRSSIRSALDLLGLVESILLVV